MTPFDPVSEALESTLERFGAMVRSVAWRRGLRGQDLEEVLQEVRVRMWRARGDSAAIQASPASYVYRTAMSAALDLLRQRRRAIGSNQAGDSAMSDSAATAMLESVPSTLPEGGSPARVLDAAELERAVESALTAIPASRQAVVRMYLMGHPLPEIARLMCWPEPKTRSLLYRGLAGLRAELVARGYGPTEAS